MQAARWGRLVGVMVLGSVLGGAAGAQEPGRSGKASPPPVLLELFTSEGCSSCPPADALLRELNGTKSSSGQLLIGLSEHVTYWNRLGWADPFSSDLYTNRQTAYSDRFHLQGVYTPQLVVNGNAEVVGSSRDAVERAIAAQRRQPAKVAVTIVSAKREAGQLLVTYRIAPTALPEGGVDVFAVLADDLDRSNVLRGENGGRTLAHAAVARAFSKPGRLRGAAEDQQITLALPPKGPGDGAAQHVVVFAQAHGLGSILGADAQALVQP